MLAGEDRAQGRLTDDIAAEDLIDRLYEVAVDPLRYEALLDHWEAMLAPQRAVANATGAPAGRGLERIEGHLRRADSVLDRAIAGTPAGGPDEAVRDAGHAAAFAADPTLTLLAANAACARAFGAANGGRVEGLALGPGEAELLGCQIRRMFASNSPGSVILRIHGAPDGHPVLFTLRVMRPAEAPPFLLAVSTEVGWPDEFSDLLRGAFELTAAEVEVLRGLAEGLSAPEIAAGRRRSLGTVRAQIKSVMAKTETRSQAELVRLTLSTMEMARVDESKAAPPDASRGFGSLAPRPFRSIRLPDGRRSDHLVLGDPQGRPCLFLPQDYGLVRWPATAEAEAARRGIKVVVPVRAGYGASTPLPKDAPYLQQLCDDLARLLDHHRIDGCPIISLGGDSFLAIAFHAAYPSRVTALIAAAGVLPLTRPEQYERMEKWHRFILAGARYTPHLLPFMVKAGFALARRLGKRGFVHAVYGGCPADILTFEIPEVYEAIVCGSEVALSAGHSAHDAFTREVIHHETADWAEAMAALQDGGLPVHFLNGLQDPQVPPATLDEFRRDHPWINFTVYPDAGQLLFFLKWRDVLARLEPHLDHTRRASLPQMGYDGPDAPP